MAVLVTGIGYIGSELVSDLLKEGEDVVGVDNFFSTPARAIRRLRRHPRFRFIRGDVADPQVMDGALSGDVRTVYSLASQSSAHPQAAPAAYTERANLVAPRVLLDAMVARGVKRLVYGSSLRVYGERLPAVLPEDARYGAFRDLSHLSKCYAEKLMEMYAIAAGLACVTVRLGIVYGVGRVMKEDPRFMTVPGKFCRQAVEGEALQVYPGGQLPIGLLHVRDAAGAMLCGAAAATEGRLEVLNAATETNCVRGIAGAVAQAAERRGLHPAVVDRSEGPEEQASILSRLPQYGFAARHTLASGIEEMLDYWTAKCG